MPYSSIVVGTDGSPSAERAIAQAASLAVADGARLVIVTAYHEGEGPTHDVAADAVPEDIRHVLTDRVQAEELAGRGRELAREAGARSVVVQALAGEPAGAIIEAAADFSADLIVVGSRGLDSHAHFILGSVASSVAHHAPCDVLVAHTV
ncbi:MAG: universal stress protein [Acidimicrobiia bacterium]